MFLLRHRNITWWPQSWNKIGVVKFSQLQNVLIHYFYRWHIREMKLSSPHITLSNHQLKLLQAFTLYIFLKGDYNINFSHIIPYYTVLYNILSLYIGVALPFSYYKLLRLRNWQNRTFLNVEVEFCYLRVRMFTSLGTTKIPCQRFILRYRHIQNRCIATLQ